MPKSSVNLLQHQIDESQHDIESIGIYIDKQDDASISMDQISCLRGLQEMYRDRILSQQREILELELRPESSTVGLAIL